jgi:hypothetical protein
MTAKLTDGPRRSAFVESAARLDRIARPGEQNGEAPAPLQAAADRMAAVSPDETWAKRFMSMGIGPDMERSSALANPPLPRPKLAPKQQAAPAPQMGRRLAKPEKPMPIGAHIGKPVRRSLLGRLIRGG